MHKHEKTLLACWVNSPSDALTTQLTPGHFTQPEHRKIAAALMVRGWTSDTLIDAAGFNAFLALADRSGSTLRDDAAKAERALMDNFAVKAAEEAAAAFLKHVRTGSNRNLGAVQGLVRRLHAAEAMGPVRSRSHAQVAGELIGVWLHDLKESKEPSTLPFPWPGIQGHTRGLPANKLIMIGGPSSEHKTTVARSIAAHLAKSGHRVVFWTLEDSEEEIAGRTLAHDSRVLTTKALADRGLPQGRTGITGDDMAEILDTATQQIDGPIGRNLRYIDVANPRLSSILTEIKAEAARGTVAFFGDFLQLARPDNPKQPATNDWWRDAVASFAGLAKQLGILIVWTSQIEKTATKESRSEGRIPRAVEMPFGAVIRQGAFGCIMVGLLDANQAKGKKPKFDDDEPPDEPPHKILVMELDKWKSAPNIDRTPEARWTFNVQPEHDRLTEIERIKS